MVSVQTLSQSDGNFQILGANGTCLEASWYAGIIQPALGQCFQNPNQSRFDVNRIQHVSWILAGSGQQVRALQPVRMSKVVFSAIDVKSGRHGVGVCFSYKLKPSNGATTKKG